MGNRKLTFLIVHCSFLICNAQSITTSSRMLGIGGTRILDTYLSQEHFSGIGFSFLATSERQRVKHSDSGESTLSHWSTLMEHEANFSSVKDRADNKQELEGAYNFYWGKLYGVELMNGRLKLQAGGLINASLGVIYNTSNSNNPAQARVHLNLMPTGVVSYGFSLFKKPITARYEISLPLAGIMFSPNYGQSYYEIFSQGNYDHNIVPTTFISSPEWRHMLNFDAQLSSKITLRIGYLGNMQQAKVNNLRQHVYTHRFLIGFTRRFSIIPRAL